GNTSNNHVTGGDNNTSSGNGNGHAVYVYLTPSSSKCRDATAKAGVNMSWNGTTAAGFEN
ncbi:MAG: hypothetical protein LBH06_06450, partial [Rikenellaceae bacterium]|nr:hypothetical protein [Rikenellaceae bacterium]